jgi:hypothetical protein
MLMSGDYVRIWKEAVNVCFKTPVYSRFVLEILRKTTINSIEVSL